MSSFRGDSPVRSFRDLRVWREARALSIRIYAWSGTGPIARDWALRDQVRRATVSVAANIAEGFTRYTPRDFRRFIVIARSSLAEVRSHISIAQGIGYLPEEDFLTLDDECDRLDRRLSSLHAKISLTHGDPGD